LPVAISGIDEADIGAIGGENLLAATGDTLVTNDSVGLVAQLTLRLDGIVNCVMCY